MYCLKRILAVVFPLHLHEKRRRSAAPLVFQRVGCGARLTQCFNPCGQARHFARSSVFVENAFGNTAHQLGLGGLQSVCCRFFVTGGNRLFDLTDVGTDARTACFVDCKTLFVLTCALCGLCCICHEYQPSGSFCCVAMRDANPTGNPGPQRAGDSSQSGLHAHVLRLPIRQQARQCKPRP